MNTPFIRFHVYQCAVVTSMVVQHLPGVYPFMQEPTFAVQRGASCPTAASPSSESICQAHISRARVSTHCEDLNRFQANNLLCEKSSVSRPNMGLSTRCRLQRNLQLGCGRRQLLFRGLRARASILPARRSKSYGECVSAGSEMGWPGPARGLAKADGGTAIVSLRGVLALG